MCEDEGCNRERSCNNFRGKGSQAVSGIENRWEECEADVVSRFPPVFHEWFLDTFPEPTAWLASRLAYGRTIAVMSMVGFILGFVLCTLRSVCETN
jgi:hypothetical protein